MHSSVYIAIGGTIMRNKKQSLFSLAKKTCARKVRICTIKFCAVGCLVENYDDDDIV